MDRPPPRFPRELRLEFKMPKMVGKIHIGHNKCSVGDLTIIVYAVSSQIQCAAWRDAAGILECVWLASAFRSGLARSSFNLRLHPPPEPAGKRQQAAFGKAVASRMHSKSPWVVI